MRVRRVLCVGAVAAAVMAAGGVGLIRDARSAPAAPAAQSDQVTRLAKRVATLEQEVTTLQQTMRHICVHGQLLAHATADSAGNLSTEYVHCAW
jgi:hypothetical protein